MAKDMAAYCLHNTAIRIARISCVGKMNRIGLQARHRLGRSSMKPFSMLEWKHGRPCSLKAGMVIAERNALMQDYRYGLYYPRRAAMEMISVVFRTARSGTSTRPHCFRDIAVTLAYRLSALTLEPPCVTRQRRRISRS